MTDIPWTIKDAGGIRVQLDATLCVVRGPELICILNNEGPSPQAVEQNAMLCCAARDLLFAVGALIGARGLLLVEPEFRQKIDALFDFAGAAFEKATGRAP